MRPVLATLLFLMAVPAVAIVGRILGSLLARRKAPVSARRTTRAVTVSPYIAGGSPATREELLQLLNAWTSIASETRRPDVDKLKEDSRAFAAAIGHTDELDDPLEEDLEDTAFDRSSEYWGTLRHRPA